jgi:micrococcal nuclease
MPTTFGPYPAKVIAIHDGDTLTVDIDLGFDHLIAGQDWNGKTRLSCRIYGINAPELDTAAGKAALAYAETVVKVGDLVTVISHGWDKYGGRFDGEIVLADGSSFAQNMLDAGQAVVLKESG